MDPSELTDLVRAVTGRDAVLVRVGSKGTAVVRIVGGVTQRHRLDVERVLNPGDHVIVLGEWEDRK